MCLNVWNSITTRHYTSVQFQISICLGGWYPCIKRSSFFLRKLKSFIANSLSWGKQHPDRRTFKSRPNIVYQRAKAFLELILSKIFIDELRTKKLETRVMFGDKVFFSEQLFFATQILHVLCFRPCFMYRMGPKPKIASSKISPVFSHAPKDLDSI